MKKANWNNFKQEVDTNMQNIIIQDALNQEYRPVTQAMVYSRRNNHDKLNPNKDSKN